MTSPPHKDCTLLLWTKIKLLLSVALVRSFVTALRNQSNIHSLSNAYSVLQLGLSLMLCHDYFPKMFHEPRGKDTDCYFCPEFLITPDFVVPGWVHSYPAFVFVFFFWDSLTIQPLKSQRSVSTQSYKRTGDVLMPNLLHHTHALLCKVCV